MSDNICGKFCVGREIVEGFSLLALSRHHAAVWLKMTFSKRNSGGEEKMCLINLFWSVVLNVGLTV